MRRFRRHERGLAEIVGTLMLVVIVVAAVTAFSLFVASYQAQVQAEQNAAHNRALEDIRILSVSTVLNTSAVPPNSNYSSLSFVAGSLDVNTMTVNELAINGQVINFYTVTPLSSPGNTLQVCEFCDHSQPEFQNTVSEFNLTSLEQVRITVSLTTWNPTSLPHSGFLSFYNLTTSGPTNFVSISLYTILGDDFTHTFTAPTAIALTEPSQIYSGNAYIPVVVFDGSGSIIPENDSIVSWTWTISTGGAACYVLSGEKVLVPQSEFPSGTYTVGLTVTDAGGLAGSTSIPFVSKVTSPSIMACPSQGQAGTPVTIVGTGFTSGTTITATISAGAAISGCGATVTGGTFSCTVTITGPASGTPYTVTATGSDGGNDTATASFTMLPPIITLVPAQGPSGVTVTASGSGFTPGVTITFTISGSGTIGTPSACTATGTGTFSGCTFTVSGVAAVYTVTATGSDGTFDKETVSFTITTPGITLTPTQGPSDVSVGVSGTGFTPGVTITTSIGAGATIGACGATVSGTGTFSCTATITGTASGTPYTMTATGSDGGADTATTSFTITTPAVTLVPTQGPSGVTVTASGSGFTPGVTIAFTITAGGTIGAASACTATGTGTFSGCTFTVSGAAATYTLTATGSDGSFDKVTASFTATIPAIALAPAQGPSGVSVGVSGTGFTPSATITTMIGAGATIGACGAMVTGTGTFSCTVPITGTASGTPYTVTATGSDGGADTATASFTITTPAVTLVPTQGPSGVTVTASGSGFTPGVTIAFTITTGGSIGVASACTATGTGTFSGCTFTVSGAAAVYTVTATGSDGGADTATASFTVTIPAITLVPPNGSSGTAVTASGSGFTPGVTITFTISAGGTIGAPSACTVNGTGTFSGCTFTVSGAAAAYTVTTTGSDGTFDKATATFTVT